MEDFEVKQNRKSFNALAEARVKQGMLPSPVVFPMDKFSNCSTKSQLDQFRRFSNKQIYLNVDFAKHQGADLRLKARENLYNLTPPPGKTYFEYKEKIRKSDNEHLVSTFGNQRIGIHGDELPKFREHLQVFCNESKVALNENKDRDTNRDKKFLKKLNIDISDPPNKIQFSPENYRTKSQYLRVRDKNVGAVRKSKDSEHKKGQSRIYYRKKKTGFLFRVDKTGRSIRSRGFDY